MRVLWLALVLLLWSDLSHATSCAMPELGPSTEGADVVLVAKVTAARDHSIYTLAVERVFKGSAPKSVKARGGGMVGSSFEVGKRFLVFGKLTPSDGQTQLFAHLCGGTQLADQAKDWIAKLGGGSAPGKALAGGAAPSAAPDAAPSPDPAPEPEPSAAPEPAPETAPPSSAAPPVGPPTSRAPAAAPADGGGCAACALGAPPSSAHDLLPALGLLAFVAMAARRSMIRP